MRIFNIIPIILSLLLSSTAAHSPSNPTSLTPWEQIHQTLNTYPLAIDFKNGPLFASVFAPDAFANYTGYLSNLTGIDAIRDGLLQSVSGLASQHQLGTTVINIAEDAQSANSTTYFTASLFSVAPATAGDFTILFGLYADDLVNGVEGWRIVKRQLVFMAPNLGNLTLG
ncbi:hypothetical protein H2200_008368 [Cladophialophora chaetospira]|uniref:SnoaL-like domain-containing protein n=1 Tax=Cladophialophora chaetospira TaxID=386627 RepID=A0AA38X5M7_9EURO|nr:hypothetical protein H2200_008368 [Cladophialophora chaetospira]